MLARCDERGGLIAEGGRVEVRYRPDSPRAYRAGAANLEPTRDSTVLPDDHCVPADTSPETKTPTKSGKTRPGGASAPAGKKPELVAYADGACTGNPGPAGLGALVIDGDTRQELSEYLGHGTNNVAELTAILRVAERLDKEVRHVEIRTDSQYSIGVLSKGWKAKANQALVAECKMALSRLGSVRLAYVAGHSGEPGNERVDELARQAITRRGTEPWKPG